MKIYQSELDPPAPNPFVIILWETEVLFGYIQAQTLTELVTL